MVRKWMSNNYNKLRIAAQNIKTKDFDDIFNEVCIQFLLIDSGKTAELIYNNDANRYFMSMFKINVYSKNSPYQRKYNLKKVEQLLDYQHYEYDNTYDICWKDFENFIDDIDIFFVDKIIYKDYIERKIKQRGYSINKMAQESTIPKGTLDLKFKKIRNELKNKKNNINDEESGND